MAAIIAEQVNCFTFCIIIEGIKRFVFLKSQRYEKKTGLSNYIMNFRQLFWHE